MADPKAPLLPGVSQFDVDFVIPRVGIDLQIGIDPFLLYKSYDEKLRELHAQILAAFNHGIETVKSGNLKHARIVLDYPEVAEIGFGYTRGGKRGSGVGTQLAGLIIDTLKHSPSLQERGVRHIEEMQLLSAGIGADRISDISANILKRYLIEYTQRQCAIWDIPLTSGVPLRHVFDNSSGTWSDGYFDLPVSPIDQTAILLVPRRTVRVLPWINYDDFLRTEFRTYLAAKRTLSKRSASVSGERDDASTPPEGTPSTAKPGVVAITRKDVSLVDRYVRAREQDRAGALPTFEYIDDDAYREAERLKSALANLQPGREDAAAYQRLVLEVVNFLFNPDLTDGRPEVRTIDGTERRDLTFINESDDAFWTYLRTEHSSLLVVFEAKNVTELDMSAINQTAVYLGDRMGRFGLVVTRNPPGQAVFRKTISVWNDSGAQRKVILIIDDSQMKTLLDRRCRGQSTTHWLRDHYRHFRQSAQ